MHSSSVCLCVITERLRRGAGLRTQSVQLSESGELSFPHNYRNDQYYYKVKVKYNSTPNSPSQDLLFPSRPFTCPTTNPAAKGMKPSLPSFVDLLSSLGLNEKDQPPPPQPPQQQQLAQTAQRPAYQVHLRTDSWGSTQSSASSSQRISPLHSPQVRLSGRQSSFATSSRRFSPYGPPRDVSLLPLLDLLGVCFKDVRGR